MELFPGIAEPTDRDHLGSAVADEQLNLILGLREIRIQRQMSLADVATEMGIDQSQVSRLESGSTNPTMSTIRRYAKAVMGVFRVQTFKWEDDPHRATSRFSGTLMSPAGPAGPAEPSVVHAYNFRLSAL
ncbi:helix-turn-helix domain-containing protein [Nocardia sp. SC052]|uniref:helix-turn-helix domain-containing protein n=1 Tax=Nocardia sichangensis TaxID=3385975 RepID=UPI0039A06FC0